ncbi:hypothetical protein CspHIS471_0204550 [Cutaneotrichosporon sp. HIS471]|nr:hypothetical protein CspHIS471_0204550 [Cutaneotrichosporon sp. HIS471]
MSFRGRGRNFNGPRDGGRDRGGGRYGRDDPGQYPPIPPGPPYGGGGGGVDYGHSYQDNHSDSGPSRGRRGGPPRGGRGGRDGPGPRRDRDQGYGRDRRDEPYPPHGRDRQERGPPNDGPRRGLPDPVRPNPSKQVRLERLARERVSRTLFVRNIAYETASDKFRADFERFGEIRELFDSISRRGLAFVTFFDVRGAEAGRREMHGTKIYGRAIDVHFGLPKEHDREGPCDQSKNQGSLLASIHPPRPMQPDELGPVAEQSGAIKSIRDGNHPAEKIVEFYDSRAAVDFHDRMASRPFGGGTLDLQYIWDDGEVVNPDPVRADAVISSTFVNRRELLDREGRSHEYPELFPDRYPERRGQSPPRRYGGGGGGGGRYNDAPPTHPPPSQQDPGRLEEARKVQNLLASLGSVPAINSGGGPDVRGPPPPRSGYGGPHPPGPPPDPRRDSYSGPPPGAPPMNYLPGPSPVPYSSASYPPHSSSYPPPTSSYTPSNYPPGPPPNSYPPPAPASASSYPPPAPASSYPPPVPASSYPPQHSPPAPVPSYVPQHSPVASNTAVPSQVLAMLQPQQHGQQGYNSNPSRQPYDQRPMYNAPPPQQGYPPGSGYGSAPEYSPARPQPSYGSQPPQQQGYDPKNGGDVGSLLAMLNR